MGIAFAPTLRTRLLVERFIETSQEIILRLKRDRRFWPTAAGREVFINVRS